MEFRYSLYRTQSYTFFSATNCWKFHFPNCSNLSSISKLEYCFSGTYSTKYLSWLVKASIKNVQPYFTRDSFRTCIVQYVDHFENLFNQPGSKEFCVKLGYVNLLYIFYIFLMMSIISWEVFCRVAIKASHNFPILADGIESFIISAGIFLTNSLIYSSIPTSCFKHILVFGCKNGFRFNIWCTHLVISWVKFYKNLFHCTSILRLFNLWKRYLNYINRSIILTL